MDYNVGKIDARYNFVVRGVSYIGKPQPNTAMFVSKRIEGLLENLLEIENCLVFAEDTIEVPSAITFKNCVIKTCNPQLAYAQFANDFAKEKELMERTLKYVLTEEGYYVSETAKIGLNAYIEPGCVIGHNVIIGDNATILAGTSIKNAVIGNNFLVNENAVIGAKGFTIAEDDSGRKFRIPTLGKVYIGNCVEIGALNNIACGLSGNTVIEDNVKIDALVHVGHDAYLERNIEIIAGGMIGGFAVLGVDSHLGLSSTIRNRVKIGKKCWVGMEATVNEDVPEETMVPGIPMMQRKLKKIENKINVIQKNMKKD